MVPEDNLFLLDNFSEFAKKLRGPYDYGPIDCGVVGEGQTPPLVRYGVVRSPKSGRPKKLTSRAAKHLVRAVRINPSKTASDLKKEAADSLGLSISQSTSQRALPKVKLVARRPAKKPVLILTHRKVRLVFARAHRNWTV